MSESELEMAARHVREGERHVLQQHAIIAQLERDGHEEAAKTAQELLRTFEATFGSHRSHLERLLRASRRH